MFDLHIHTRNSRDSKMTPADILDSASRIGLSGIAVTDHADLGLFDTVEPLFEVIQGSVRDAREIERMSGGTLRVLRGVEIGGAPYDLEGARQLLSRADLDIVLGSIHSVKGNGFDVNNYSADFSQMAEEEIYLLLQTYLERVRDLVSLLDIDVLAHLTYPLRYMNGKYQRGIDIGRFYEQIDEILQIIIARGIALEVNTASVDTLVCDFIPSADILARYRDLGGRLLTLGSDAHRPGGIGKGIADAKEMLRTLGFHEYHYFEKHRPVAVPLLEEGA